MADVHRCYECGKDAAITYGLGTVHLDANGSPDLSVKHAANVVPTASRSMPPCPGDVPAWTEDEVRKAAVAQGATDKGDAWVALWKDESRYNETCLVKSEREERHKTPEQKAAEQDQFKAAVDAEIARRAAEAEAAKVAA